MLQGADVLGVETSSPLPSLVDHPRQSQLEGLPRAGLPLPAPPGPFSVWEGSSQPGGACAGPARAPPGLALGRTRAWHRGDTAGSKCSADKAKVLFPREFTGECDASPCIRLPVISLLAPRGCAQDSADRPWLSRGTCQLEVSQHFVIINRWSFLALTRGLSLL